MPESGPEAGYIRRLDPDWISTIEDLGDVKKQVEELIVSNHRQERYLVGGWTADGTAWIEGVREKIERVEKLTRWFWAIAAGVWSIVAMIVYEIIRGAVIKL